MGSSERNLFPRFSYPRFSLPCLALQLLLPSLRDDHGGETTVRRSKAEIYLHLVWATHNRQPWLTPELAPPIYERVTATARRLRCTVLGLGGMPDHVHLLVRLPPITSISLLAQQVKGSSSRLAREVSQCEEIFRWQEGYGVFSVSRSHVSRVVSYVENQAKHHANKRLWSDWEEVDEESELDGV